MDLLGKIRDDLNPEFFTVQEIVEEGLDSVLYVGVDPTAHSDNHRVAKVGNAVERLVAMGLVEVDTEKCASLRLTMAGVEEQTAASYDEEDE